MATNKVQSVLIDLNIQGAEKLAALKGSFRDLGKTIGQTDNDIDAARKSVIEYGKTANQSEAVVKGQIKAFEGLREQAQMGGKVYRELSDDIATLKSQLNGSTPAIDAQRKSILELASGAEVTAKQVEKAIQKLSSLRAETRLDSGAFNAFGKDIDGLVRKLDQLSAKAEETAKNRRLLSGGIRATPGQIRAQFGVFSEEAAASQARIDEIDDLKKSERSLAEVEERAQLQIKLAQQLKDVSQTGFLTSVESGRKSVIAYANAFNDADKSISGFNKRLELLDKTFGEIPNTVAGSNQRLRELQQQFANTERSASNYVTVALEVARVQREASAATQGLGAALIKDLASGAAVKNQKNLREVIGQLQAEMSELNTETAEGSAKYAENARQVNNLQKELDDIARSYRTVGDMARQAGASMSGSLNPFTVAGGRRRATPDFAAYEQPIGPEISPAAKQAAESRKQEIRDRIANLQKINAENSALREQNAIRKSIEKNRKKLAARAGVEPPVREISGLYQGIADIGMSKITADIDRMGNSYDQVASDIRNATKASNGSINSLQAQRNAWASLRAGLDPAGDAYREVGREIEKVDRRLEKLNKNRRRMSAMQITQAAGAVLSGGIFGGPEGFFGGAAGALVGGVGGAFAGAAIGAQVGGIRRTLGEYADYAAQISRLEIALEGITKVQDDAVASQANYAKALGAAADATKRLNVPQEVAIQGITRLTAAVKGAGGGVAEAELAFKNINSAIIATGGGAEQVQGAVTALVQIFSKGKVSAEEINQIAERLPGTFNKIAEASGRTGPELTKALQQGTVGLNDLMKFLVSLGDDYGKLAEKIASSQENAGARLQVAFNELRIEVGNALKPVGAEFQSAFAEFIKEITPALINAARAVGEGLRFIVQNREAIAVAASFALKLGGVSLALKAFAALNGPVSTMFALLKSGFKASSQQAALAQGKLLAFGRTVKALAASLVAPVVITFAVIGAEAVISYFNRIKKAREDLEATAKKPQGEVFFRSIGGTAATKQTLQRNINDITKNLDILRDRVKSTKEELSSLNEATEVTYGGGGGLSTRGVASASREDLKARLKADEAEINRLVLNYRTLVDKYLDAPDAPGLKDFANLALDKDGNDKKARVSQLESIKNSEALLGIEKQILDNAREITQAQADSNTGRVNQLNNQKISLEFAKRSAENELEYRNAILNAANDENREAMEAKAFLQKEIQDKLLLIQYESALADEAQRSALAAKERQKALSDEIFNLREELGLVTDIERIRRFREERERQYGQGDPEVDRLTDLYRQTIDPTFLEGVQQSIRSLQKELDGLLDPINTVTGAAATIGEAFSKSFTDAITGAATTQEALAGFFSNVGNYFLDLAGKIIAKLIEIALLDSVTSVFGGSSGGPGLLSGLLGFRDGGVFDQIQPARNNIVPFAEGGIVDKPTLFKYADGGTGRFGLMGEAGSEAILPLRRGSDGRLGVEASGGIGNIIVNVDASGSEAQGDGKQAQQLGKVIGAAIQAELIKQKRPGGLLS